jgi:hypothetical protein
VEQAASRATSGRAIRVALFMLNLEGVGRRIGVERGRAGAR